MAEISTGAPGLLPAEVAKGEGCRVLEVDETDEPLSGIQAVLEDRLGNSEPSMGDSFLPAFKGADFDQFDDDEKPAEEVMTAMSLVQAGERPVMAKNAARGIRVNEARRNFEIAR